MTPKTRMALELLRDKEPMSAGCFGAALWPKRGGPIIANHGGGDYAAQMFLGRLKSRGLVQYAPSKGSTLWELSAKGHRELGR